MRIHTLTGTTIQAALLEARRRFGDEVVLLESIPPQGDQPARITIMVDERVEMPEVLPHGYGAALHRAQKAAGQSATLVNETADVLLAQKPSSEKPAAISNSRGQLFPQRPTASAPPAAPRASVDAANQLERLSRRIARLERQLGNALVGTSHRWLAHPLATELLRQGLRSSTVIHLFDRLLAQGFDPEQPEEQLRWALAREMRRQLAPTTPRPLQGTLVCIGPAGAGKTSLVLKLARHPSFFGRRSVAVLILMPEEAEAQPYVSPVELYRRFELPVQTVTTPSEMATALRRIQDFDQILIDTPSLPLLEGPARRLLLQARQLLSPIVPLQVLFTVSATINLEDLTPEFLQRLPLTPDALVLTHWDEVRRPGRLYDWLVTLARPVACISRGSRVPESLEAFSPTAYIEQLLRL
jgi:flagellar biosynthesis protein FlhF